jgi:cytochrome c553
MINRRHLKPILLGLLLGRGLLLSAQSPQPQAGQSGAPLPPPLPPPLPGFSQPITIVTNPIAVPSPTLRPTPAPLRVLPNLPPRPVVPVPVAVPSQAPSPLVWDAETKEYTARPGETNVLLTFNLTNTAPSEVLINDVRTSCGCTVARLPEYPWKLAGGTNGQIQVTADLRGKRGLLHKIVYVYTAAYGVKPLTIKVNIPDPMGDRGRNLQIAAADRQAVFKNDCAKCHAEPAIGKKSAELYTAACAICHDAEHRATMVPDLRALNHPTNRDHWKTWVGHGKPGTLMPAFAKSEGGPLTDEQVDSLADYLAEHVPSRPAAAPSTGASH